MNDSSLLQYALSDTPVNWTQTEKERLAVYRDAKIKEQSNYDANSTHYKRLAIQIDKLKQNIGRL